MNWSEIVAVEVRDRSGASARFENLAEAFAYLGYRRFVAILLDLERPPSLLLDAGRVVVRDEMGLDIPKSVEMRVWDSTADLRYAVLPMRPAGTEQ